MPPPLRLSRKLIVVSKWSRRRRKALVETHIIYAYHVKMKVMCDVKVRSKVKKHRFHSWGPKVGKTGCKELKLIQSAVICLWEVLHENEAILIKVKIKVRS